MVIGEYDSLVMDALKVPLWEWKYLEIDFGIEEQYRNARNSSHVVAC